jgi:Protein of unknown function, DUF547
MKKIIFFAAFLLVSNNLISQTQALFFEQTNEFLKKNVTGEGKINYVNLKKSPGELLYILDNAAKLKLEAAKKEEQIAFWINAYNLLLIKNVMEIYPVKYVNSVPGFFDKKNSIATSELSLNEIEKNLIDLNKDPGLNFVLSNGSNDGARLLNAAYIPEILVNQISFQMKSTINKPGYIKANKDNSLELPKVFETRKSDFTTAYFNEIDFINIFIEKKLDPKSKITYSNTDLSLNEIK